MVWSFIVPATVGAAAIIASGRVRERRIRAPLLAQGLIIHSLALAMPMGLQPRYAAAVAAITALWFLLTVTRRPGKELDG